MSKEAKYIELIKKCIGMIEDQAIELSEWTGDKSCVYFLSTLVSKELEEIINDK